MSWSETVDWSPIPERMRGGIARSVEQGIPPGRFLQSVFRNNLKEAVARADDENILKIVDYVRFLYNNCPRGCWGSHESYHKWLSHKGLQFELENACGVLHRIDPARAISGHEHSRAVNDE